MIGFMDKISNEALQRQDILRILLVLIITIIIINDVIVMASIFGACSRK